MQRLLIGYALGFLTAALLLGTVFLLDESRDPATESASTSSTNASRPSHTDGDAAAHVTPDDDRARARRSERSLRPRTPRDTGPSPSSTSATGSSGTSADLTGPPNGAPIAAPELEEVVEWDAIDEDDDVFANVRSQDWQVRNDAAQALGHWDGTPEVVQALVSLLDDTEPEVRDSAAWSLGQIGADAAASVPRLIELMRSSTGRLRERAAIALGNIGQASSAAVPDLIELLQHPDPEVQDTAAYSLGRVGAGDPAAVQALIGALDSPYSKVRSEALESLAMLGATAADAGPRLLEHVRAGRAREWEFAVDAARAVGVDDDELALALARHLDHADPDVRRVARNVLAELGSAAAVATDAARAALPTATGDDFSGLFRILVAAGERDTADAELTRRLRTASPGDVSWLLGAVEDVGAELPSAGAALAELTRTVDGDWFDFYANSLISLGAPADVAVPALAERLRDPDWATREAAAEQLTMWGAEAAGAIPELVRALRDDRPDVRTEAANALGAIGPAAAAAIPALRQATEDSFGSVRTAATDALASIE